MTGGRFVKSNRNNRHGQRKHSQTDAEHQDIVVDGTGSCTDVCLGHRQYLHA